MKNLFIAACFAFGAAFATDNKEIRLFAFIGIGVIVVLFFGVWIGAQAYIIIPLSM